MNGSYQAATIAKELRPILSRLKRRLREQGGRHELTPSQVAVILRLEKDGASAVSTLARAEGMRPQSMSAIVKVLQDAQLISSSPDPNDGRQTLMSLTKTCRKFLEDGRAAREDWLTQTIERNLSLPEQKKLSAALRLLARLVEE
jgi:DNA-binding MarR family transcriptional regulator